MADQHLKNENDDYTFLQEKIKERPINKRKVFKQSILTITLAIVFALVACFVFFFFQDSIVKLFDKNEPEQISLTLYETSDVILPEDMLQEQDTPPVVTNEISMINNAAISYEPTINDFQNMYNKMKTLAQTSNKSLVNVTGVKDGTDWLLNSYENHTQTTGVIIGDNGTDLLILINSKNITTSKEIVVTFFNTQEAKGALKSVDKYNNLAIITVPLTELQDTTRSAISYAELANSAVSSKSGDLIIAVGDPYSFGTSSIGYGIITSTGNEINGVDHNFSLITTDIYGSVDANGVLINQKGKIIGIIDQSYNSKEFSNQISAIGVTELKTVIENLCNDNVSAHMGIYMTNVTPFARQYYSIPPGAYVTNILLDSPAMDNGIHKGDVIVAINDAVITNALEYEMELGSYSPNDNIVVTLMRPSGDTYIEMDIKLTLSE